MAKTYDLAFGQWQGSPVVLPRQRLNEVLENLKVMNAVGKASSWDQVLAQYSLEQVAEAGRWILDAAWATQACGEGRISDEEFDDAQRPPAELPDLERFKAAEDFWMAFERPDDSERLAEWVERGAFPEFIMERAFFLETSPMTGYDPIAWTEESMAEIRREAIRRGWSLVNVQELLDEAQDLLCNW